MLSVKNLFLILSVKTTLLRKVNKWHNFSTYIYC